SDATRAETCSVARGDVPDRPRIAGDHYLPGDPDLHAAAEAGGVWPLCAGHRDGGAAQCAAVPVALVVTGALSAGVQGRSAATQIDAVDGRVHHHRGTRRHWGDSFATANCGGVAA